MKTIGSLLVISLLVSGCLVPGSPLYYRFRAASSNKPDSLTLVSFPGKWLQYRYRAQVYDSVFIANAKTGHIYLKMQWDQEFNTYAVDAKSATIAERRRNEKTPALYLKKYSHQQVEYDTLSAVKQVGAK